MDRANRRRRRENFQNRHPTPQRPIGELLQYRAPRRRGRLADPLSDPVPLSEIVPRNGVTSKCGRHEHPPRPYLAAFSVFTKKERSGGRAGATVGAAVVSRSTKSIAVP